MALRFINFLLKNFQVFSRNAFKVYNLYGTYAKRSFIYSNVNIVYSCVNLVYQNGLLGMNMNFRKIFYWLLTLFGIYVIFEIVRTILGGSLSFEQLVIAILVLIMGLIYKISTQLSDLNSKISGHIGWHKGQDAK